MRSRGIAAFVEHAEERLRDRHQSFAGRFKAEAANAKEGEVVILQPGKEIEAFRDVVGRQARWRCLDFIDKARKPRQHGPPVFDRLADVRERVGECRDHRAARFRVIDAIDMNVDQAFPGARSLNRVRPHAAGAGRQGMKLVGSISDDREARMHHKSWLKTLLAQLGHHRVDQERHVVIEEFNDGDVIKSAPCASGRIGHMNVGSAGLALGDEAPSIAGDGGKFGSLVLQQIFKARAGKKLGHEIRRRTGAAALQDGARLCQQLPRTFLVAGCGDR